MPLRDREARRKSAEVIRQFRALGCALCGEKEDCCLTAHHKNPEEKRFNLSEGRRKYSVDVVKKELEKCICLCANCHSKVHAGVISLQ